MGQCCYKNCQEKATTKGFVLARKLYGGNEIPTEVEACDKHKKVKGFIEIKNV